MDALTNLATSTVATAPSPATSGTSLVVAAGTGVRYPAVPFDVTLCAPGTKPDPTNAEIARCTAVSTDTLTLTRAQYGTTAQSVSVGWYVDNDVTANLLSQLVPLSTVTTAGDLIVGTGAGTVGRLGIGANGDVLTVSAGALGYAAPATGVDLLQFFQSTLPSSQNWYSVAYGNGAFVAVAGGPSTAAAYSTNGGVTWTAATLPSSQGWRSVAYGNGAFVAVATGSTAAAYSTNGGVTWTASTLPSSQNWQSVTYGNGAFVAVTYGSTAAAYSTNGGVTWTASTLPSSSYWRSVAYGNGAFVAVAYGPSTAAAYTQVVALASANTATVSSPSVTSGTAFTPSTASNATVYFQINAASSGSYTLTMGPTTGAENTIGSAVAMVAGSDAIVTLVVPRSWLVVLTLTSVALGSTTVVAM